jgi:hypothetical protein
VPPISFFVRLDARHGEHTPPLPWDDGLTLLRPHPILRKQPLERQLARSYVHYPGMKVGLSVLDLHNRGVTVTVETPRRMKIVRDSKAKREGDMG